MEVFGGRLSSISRADLSDKGLFGRKHRVGISFVRLKSGRLGQ
jgi:hypothetical protein